MNRGFTRANETRSGGFSRCLSEERYRTVASSAVCPQCVTLTCSPKGNIFVDG
jgi:hypothetical protein